MANKQIETENKIMKEILLTLNRLGTQVTRKELKQEIRLNSEVFSEEEIDTVRVSKKTGKSYRPFDWSFNFAVKHLILAGFLTKLDGSRIELAKKGRNVELTDFDANRDVRLISEPKFPHGKIKKNNPIKVEPTEEENDEVEEWRIKLLAALQNMSPKKFEYFCRGLLTKMGVDIDESIGVQFAADGGLDGFGYVRSDDYRTTRVALQAKRWQNGNIVQSPEIDKFRGAIG